MYRSLVQYRCVSPEVFENMGSGCLRGPVMILTLLSPKAAGQTPLHIAAEEGDEATVKYFYSVHANPNITDKFGEFLGGTYNEILSFKLEIRLIKNYIVFV